MKRTKITGILTAIAMTVPLVLTSCGQKGNDASEDTTFSWWLYSGPDASYYTEYTENPAIQYTLDKTWGEENKTLSFEFWQPASGTARDNYTTMIASGDLPDIIDAVVSDPPEVMVQNGYALDITEYVEQYMPNYVELVHSNDIYYKNAVTLKDGEEHYYSLPIIYDQEKAVFQGYMYRRDWIVKYGTNPVTGEAFTGGYTDESDYDSWVDDVVFPSGETDPVYISDWEWMFDIFTKAQADLGIDDSYCMSLYYPGFTWNSGLISSFGGGNNTWYQDEERQVQFGGDSAQKRAYLECMNSWYEKGWLDAQFNTRTSDVFYSIDNTSVRQGKVGMWNGLQSELGGRMDANDGGYTEGIYVAGAPYPINDIYGTDDCKYIEPNCVMGGTLVEAGILITPKAAEKDLAALCSYLDYFYSEEGALIRSLGLSAEQVAEMQDNTFYADHGMENGAYSIREDGKYVQDSKVVEDSGDIGIACAFTKAPGIKLLKNVDLGYAETYQASLDTWSKYPNTGCFQGTITTNNMSPDEANTCNTIQSKVLEYMTNNAVDFIKGDKDIHSDEDWNTWCEALKKYNYQEATDIYQVYVDKYPFR